MSPLNSMPSAKIAIRSEAQEKGASITLTNKSSYIAFFVRAEITGGIDGEEILPITYDENYITIFPRETRTITAHWDHAKRRNAVTGLRVEGYNVAKQAMPISAGRE
jgi:exo-1,4-beta-D-glucosaminidase